MKTWTIILFLLPFCALSQAPMASHYKIYSSSKQKMVTIGEIADDLGKADVLFFGEEHNDSTGHYLEHAIFQILSEKYPGKLALSMEMFETDCQIPLNEYLAGFIREKNFTTEARAWKNYKDYRPMIELAKAKHIPVTAANAPARYVNMTNRLGLASLQQLDASSKAFLPPLPIDTATGKYYDNFVEVMGGHAAVSSSKVYQAQNLWDATMAYNIAKTFKAHPGFKIFQVNGGFHSEAQLGTAAQLKKYAPGIRILNIAAYADDSFDNPDWNKFSPKGDYIILTDPKLPKTF
ncbi:ChaN family lipoprotein [Mucilaginibacter sp. L3T2-6]|uniref:ChaN family lipoprotein n=1 Tax=Mucilaginibacter sp. L3T2-6 TaxID=3062491 RepID=UPI002674DB88|nr:ChaN family lipoprotein [Mucilaginibacter sp. L3T2-6]MDO3640898.1 ChaN family lipoprotein [Mucilaginibacter sp. L3T2-6]MDV6213626.1 ChaN family lipoprotein [Mucilaginibacter sp. L3T2-6]